MYDINDHFKIKPFVLFIHSFNPFLASVPIWYPLKTSNFLVFSVEKNKKIDDWRVNSEWNINYCEKPMFPFDTLWKPLVSLCFQGGKIGKLTTEGLILNGILTSVRSQCSHLIPSKKNLIFLSFQGEEKMKIDDRRVNFEWNINYCEKPMFPSIPPENTRKPEVF